MEPIEPQDDESKSSDIVADNISHLAALFPAAITEGKIDFEVLRQLLGDNVDEADEKYGLSWHGKRQALQLAQTPSTGTLRPCPQDSINWDTTQNLMIEGDNLEVLKLLQKSYAGKVKLIYIDPPYNTGKDFVYKDNYRDNIKNYLEQTGQTDEEGHKTSSNTEASGRYHTDWLNMMYPRLVLARSLLRSDGLIFLSIDQTELAQLRLACDQVFGETNFFAVLTRRAMHTVRNSSKDFNLNADYVLVYGRQKEWFGEDSSRYIRQQVDKSSSYPNDDGDGKGQYKLDPITARNFYTPYTYTFANGVVWTAPKGRYPSFSQESLKRLETEGAIVFSGKEPKAKRYLADVQVGRPPDAILSPEAVGFNQDGTRELAELFGESQVFSQPKPTGLVTFLAGLADDPGGIVLDFFAGSGTTADAVMRLNHADAGNRRFITVQLPQTLDPASHAEETAAVFCDSLEVERNLAELTKERLRRAAAKVAEENPGYKGDLGFRVFKLDSSNLREWDENPDDLPASLEEAAEHVKADRTDQDVLYELLLKQGIDLCVPIETKEIAGHTVQSVGAGTLITCLDQQISQDDTEPLGLGIANWHKDLNAAGETTCIFRDSAFPNDIAKTNLTAILHQHNINTIRSI